MKNGIKIVFKRHCDLIGAQKIINKLFVYNENHNFNTTLREVVKLAKYFDGDLIDSPLEDSFLFSSFLFPINLFWTSIKDGEQSLTIITDTLRAIHINKCSANPTLTQGIPKYFETKKNSTATTTGSSVDHPNHYNTGKIEVIDYIEDQKLDFCLGNAVKYISRAGKKDSRKTVEDLKKAIWYIQREINTIESDGADEEKEE